MPNIWKHILNGYKKTLLINVNETFSMCIMHENIQNINWLICDYVQNALKCQSDF